MPYGGSISFFEAPWLATGRTVHTVTASTDRSTSPTTPEIAHSTALVFIVSVSVGSLGSMTAPPGNEQLPGSGPLGLSFLGVTDTAPPGEVTNVPYDKKIPRKSVAYFLPFEIVSVHLLVVLIGAAYLARAKRRRVIIVTPAPAASRPGNGVEEAT